RGAGHRAGGSAHVSWLLPSAFAIAGVAALVATALHFIARSRPVAESLPTARFVPHRPVRARARSIALSDILLLVVRIAAILALGAAVAGPVFAGARGRVRRIVALDRSRDVGDMREARDSARAVLRAGDVLIAFDSVAAAPRGSDALDSVTSIDAVGSLSAALAAAVRAAARLSSDADSMELVLVSPIGTEEIDDATSRIRAEWPGRIRVVPVPAAPGNARTARVESTAGTNDVVIAGLSLMGVVHSVGDVRIARGRLTASDSVWASDTGHVLVHWPANDSAAGWQPRPAIDAIGGVTSASGTLVGRFPRAWTLHGNAIVRWADGEAAAVEHAVGAGCIRDVGIVLDPVSDLTLRAPFRRFVARLLEPCGGTRRSGRADSALIASLVGGTRFAALAPAAMLRDRASQSSSWAPWLLVLGAALLLAEMAARKMEKRPA
ncbi:MAG TPA: hypothetical protein VF785_21940, partial [Gemmatimonadaceae bacterium]